jgi:hypothetical protein
MKTPNPICVLLVAASAISLFAQNQEVETAAVQAPHIAAPAGPLAKPAGPDWIIPVVFSKQAELADYTNGEVHVAISLETDQKARPYLAARLTPNPGFFISSKNLPKGFMGAPTSFTLVTNAMIKTRGPVFEDTPAQEVLEEPDSLSSYYPAGTVTLRIPVVILKGDSDISAQVMVNYSACGHQICTTGFNQTNEIKISSTALTTVGKQEPRQ